METITLIVKNIARHRKSLIIVFILIIFSASITIILAGAASGTEQSMKKRFSNMADITQIRVGPSITMQKNASLNDSTLSLLKGIDGVYKVVPIDYVTTQLAFGPYISYPSVIGVDLDDLIYLGFKPSQGETKIHEKQIILGSEIPKQFMYKNLPGKAPDEGYVNLMGKFLKVILEKTTEDNQTIHYNYTVRVDGILKSTGKSSDYNAFMSIAESGKLKKWLFGQNFRQNSGYDSIIVIVKNLEKVEEVHYQIIQAGFQAESRVQDIQQIREAAEQMNKFAFATGVISLISSLAVMFLTMMTVITQRKSEIGLMKAIGATDGEVLRLFVGEAGIIGFLGGILASSLSLLLQFFLNSYLQGLQDPSNNLVIMGLGIKDIALNIPIWLFPCVPILSTISCVLAGFWPARHASALDPIETLRTE